ncbi:MAG: SHOCT domain-containing protein [Smithellaceae bacterium]
MYKIQLPFLGFFLTSLAACSDDYFFGPRGGGGWGHMMYYGYGGGFMWLLLIVIIGVLIYLVILNTKSKGKMGNLEETPIDILKKRYARGEITKDEFDKIKNDL